MMEPDQEDYNEPERWGVFGVLMRRVLGPAGAIVVLYASIFALPSLLTSQMPPIDGGDMGRVFLGAIVFFALLAVFLDYREKRKGDEQ